MTQSLSNICSVWAYHEIVADGTVGKHQAMYLQEFSSGEPLTHKQVVKLIEEDFSIDVPCYGGRIRELEEMGFIEKHDIVVCEFTHKKVNRWIFTGRRTPLPKEKIEITCPHCEGVGKIKKEVYKDTSMQKELF